MSNPIVEQGMAIFTALAALKVKRGQYRSVPEGIEIYSPGKPTLLLTHHAAREFAQTVAEAENS